MDKRTRRIIDHLWMIPTPMMLINGFPFIYIGIVVNKYKWIIAGIIFEIPLILIFTIPEAYTANDNISALLGFMMLLSPIISFIYALIIRKEYEIKINQKRAVENKIQYEFTNQFNQTINNSYNENKYIVQQSQYPNNTIENNRTDYAYEYIPTQTQYSNNTIEKNRTIIENNNPEVSSFDFNENDTETIDKNHKININTASMGEIDKLPGINIILVKKIENIREKGIIIKDIDQLAQIWELSPHHIKQLEPYLEFESNPNKSSNSHIHVDL